MTLKQAQATLRALGITLRKVDGEYQIKPRALPWASDVVSYHTDLDDAVGTGQALAVSFERSLNSDFLKAYIACALWSTPEYNAEGYMGDGLDQKYSEDDLSALTREEMRRDCEDFQVANQGLLTTVYATAHYSAWQAGHDFWLTRNGHGAGFWDRGLGAIGDELTAAANVYGSVDLYVNNGKVWS